MIVPYGWNTWDYKSYNTFVFLSGGKYEIAMQLGIFDEKNLIYRTDYRWKDLVKVGAHALDGSYISYQFRDEDAVFEVEIACIGTELNCRITPVNQTNKRIVVEILPEGGRCISTTKDALKTGRWIIHRSGMYYKDSYFIRCENDYMVSEPGKQAAFCVSQRSRHAKVCKVDSPIKKAKREFEISSPKGDGVLEDCIEGVTRAVAWNTIYDRREKGICTPVSRDWCKDWKGALIFCWDTFLIGLLSSIADDSLPWHNFDAVLHGATDEGFVPNYAISSGVKSLDRSQPPLGAHCVLKTYLVSPDKKKLKTIFPKLMKWHHWWKRERDGNHDGMLEWGSNPSPKYEFPELLKYNPYIQHEHICAAYESGQDNSPVFDDIQFNKRKNVLECSDIGLNSLYALDAEALAGIASELKLKSEAEELQNEYEKLKERINSHLWSEEYGIYMCRKWNGEFIKRLSPINFFPLIAGIASKAQAEKMISLHLLNEKEFWGKFTAPTIARNDPAFADNNYWRGRIWPPFNYLLYEGLRRYDFYEIANDFAMKSLDVFLMNWRKSNRVCENYNSESGDGADVPNSDPLYAWGALMGYIGIQEFADINKREGLRFGNLSGKKGSIRNFRIGMHSYDVSISEKGLAVRRDGKKIFSTNAPAIVRNLVYAARRIWFEFIGEKKSDACIRFHNLMPYAEYQIYMNRLELKIKADAKGNLVLRP
jgi:putative isomerase